MTQDVLHLEPHLLSRHVGRVLTLAILRLLLLCYCFDALRWPGVWLK